MSGDNRLAVDTNESRLYPRTTMASPSASPVPLLRLPTPGSRGPGVGTRTPKLTLPIPPSPSQKPLSASSEIPQMQKSATRPSAPQLRLDTPKGSNMTPHEGTMGSRHLPHPFGGMTPSENSAHSRTGSFAMLDGKVSGPSSASSASHSTMSFAVGARQSGGTPDPSSAISSIYSHEGAAAERDGTPYVLPDLERLTLEKGRDIDVYDLDDDGWMAASKAGKIEELDVLGEGAGGAVTKCKLKGGRTIFALKIITTDPDPETQKQIRRELDFNQKIAADHICKYYGAFGDSSTGIISIAMEYCEGGSLDSVYKKVKKGDGRIGEKVLGKIAESVLEGLTYLNRCKIIHRDIKPSNILLCRDGQVKLCDFGVSGEFGTRGDANTFIGTSYYMAPERITGQSYNINSDVWSLGVTLLEVAQNRFPFPADGTEMQPRAGLIDIIQYIVCQPLPKLKDEPAQGDEPEIKWSEEFKYFIGCCLEKDPDRRCSPEKMLNDSWIVETKRKRVNMGKFLKAVWGWGD